MKVLAITNLFGFPWDPSRGVFNQQQFQRLGTHVDLTVLVAVPWTEAFRRPRAYWRARRDGRKRWPGVDYFVFWYPPGVLRSLHSLFFFLSMLVQRPMLLLGTRWAAVIGSWAYPDAVAATLFARLTHTPSLMKIHGSDLNDYLAERGKRWQILAAARRCHRVMTASAALRMRLIEAGIASPRVEVNYNGVDAHRFCPADRGASRATLGLPQSGRWLLYVGNLKVAKGCVDLVDAYLALAGEFLDLNLAMVGGGPAQAAIEQRVAAAGAQARVRLVGKAAHASLPVWFAAADLLCLPSHNEGVPNVVLESMACGVPVVATAVGGIPEVVPAHAGVLVPPHDPVALQAALRLALNTRWDTARIAAHGKTFSWDANVRRVLDRLGELSGIELETEAS